MEFAVLYWYLTGTEGYSEHGGLSNFTTNEPLRNFLNCGMYAALAELSGEGWHIVHVEPLRDTHPPQRLIWLQRPLKSDNE